MDNRESVYYKSVSSALLTCSQSVSKTKMGTKPTNCYVGRAGSQDFEEIIKEGIRDDLTGIIKVYNSFAKIDNLLPLIDVVAPENSTEADERTCADVVLVFDREGSECYVPVNIKLTGGTTADNTSGWQGLGSVLFSSETPVKSKAKFYSEIKKGDINPDSTDYFFWVFHKSPAPADESIKNAIVTSFLYAYHNAELKTNFAQPLPLQLKASKTLVGFDGYKDMPTMKKMSSDLACWMLDNTVKYYEENMSKTLSAIKTLHSFN